MPRFLDEVAALRRARDQEAPGEGEAVQGDAVRVCTIHGAKGLESAIVVLADAHIYAEGERGFRALVGWHPESAFPEHVSILGRSATTGAARQRWLDVEKAREEQEYWNLLYVAATRARQVLIVSGVLPQKSDQRYEDTWYRRFDTIEGRSILPEARAPARSADGGRRVRDFLPPPCATGSVRVVLGDAPVRLGRAWHAVLEQTADTAGLARIDRNQLGRRFDIDAVQVAQVVDAAARVLTAPHLASLLAVPGEPELELLDNGELLRIDRLAQADDGLWILDFKWRVTAGDAPAYRRQVQRYCDVVRSIYRDRRVRGALITAQAELIEID